MEPEWNEVDRLFAETLDRPTAERPVYLEAVGAGNPALRQEVEQLLAADAQGRGFLESPPSQLARLILDDREEGGSLGPYRLVRPIGMGGTGTVYLARREDEHFRRDVAIKVLRSGLASTQAFHRFLAERQILAGLEHPNIARLYDGGSTDDGRPYLVMEWIDGVPVDEYCDRHQLTIDQRLVLVRKICAAVQHAHQNLLVHRDLKPANILITGEGEPKLLDFGIAKQLAPKVDDTVLRTAVESRLLTPRYASPEQVRGAGIATASDVYSLGVILYELLSGRSPYRVSAEPRYELERSICEQEPELPSLALFRSEPPSVVSIASARKLRPQALARRLSGDLDNIVRMALRKEPQRRYGSAAQLSQDLDRHLLDLPITARPDNPWYQTRKFARRHRTGLAAAAFVLILAAGFIARLVFQGRQLTRERDKARYALSFLIDTFKKADPYQTKGENLTAREILDQGADRVSRELAAQPDLQAAVMDAVGKVNLDLGRYDAAEPLLARSLELRRQVSGPAGSPDVADSLEHLAELRRERTDHAGAETLLREALVMRRLDPGASGLALARSLNLLGATLLARGVSAETAPKIEACHRQALAIARRAEQPEGLTVAESLFALAGLQRSLGSYTEAERLFREGLAVEHKILGDGDPRLYRDQVELSAILLDAGKLQETEAVLRPCLARQRTILSREHPDLLTTLNNLAVVLDQQGRYAEAEPLHRELLDLARAHYGPVHWRTATALVHLASNLEGQGKGNEATALFEQGLEIRRRTLGEKDWQVGQVLLLLAQLYRNDKQFPKALGLAHEAQKIFEAREGPDHPFVAHALREIGRNHLLQDRFAEAEPYLRRSLEIRRQKLAAPHPDLAKAQVSLARSLIGQGRYDEAVPLLQEARATFIAVYGKDHELARVPNDLLAEIERARAQR